MATIKQIEKLIDDLAKKSQTEGAEKSIVLGEALPIIISILQLVKPLLKIISKKAYNWLTEFLKGYDQ